MSLRKGYVKTELKILEAVKFDLHIEPSILHIIQLYNRYLSKESKETNEEDLKWFLNYYRLYFKSDLYFTLHPLRFNLLLMTAFLAKAGSFLEISSLLDPSTSQESFGDIKNGSLNLISELEAVEFRKKDVKASAANFRKLYDLLQSYTIKFKR